MTEASSLHDGFWPSTILLKSRKFTWNFISTPLEDWPKWTAAGPGILLGPFHLLCWLTYLPRACRNLEKSKTASNFVRDPRLWAASVKGLVLWQMVERQPDKVHAVQSCWPHHRQVLKSTPRTGNNLACLLQEPSTYSIAHTPNTTDDYWQRFSLYLMSGSSEHNYPWPNLKWALTWHT